MANVINVEDLQRAAEKYQKDFKVLPFAILMNYIVALRLRMIKVNNKDILIEEQRKGGLTKPYTPGVEHEALAIEIKKLGEKILQVQPSYCALKDHIMNYKEKQVLFDPTQDTVNNKTKKHPQEKIIIGNKIKTVAEDIIDALFPAERDVSDLSPTGMFDGYDTLIDAGIVAGDLTVGKGNYIDSGVLSAPADDDDTLAWDRLVTWIRSSHTRFSKNPVLRMPIGIYNNCSDALENKFKYKDVLFDIFLEKLRDKTQRPNLQLVVSDALGTGTRITLTEDGLYDFGMNAFGDEKFVQVRNPYEDPNMAQFWLQFEAGCRINSWHSKVFMANQGTPVANQLSGDYLS